MSTERFVHDRNIGTDFEKHVPTKKLRINGDGTIGRNADGSIGSGRTYEVLSLDIAESATQAQINAAILGVLPADIVLKVGDRAAINSGSAKGLWFLDSSGNWRLEPQLERMGVQVSPYRVNQTIDTGTDGIQAIALDATVAPGNISLGPNTTYSGGILAAELPSPVGTASTALVIGASGEYLNAIALRRSNSWSWDTEKRLRTLTTPDGKYQVFGLVQAASGTADGAAVGSSNLQISFVYEDSAGLLTPQVVVGPIDFRLPYAVSERDYPLNLQ